MRERRYVLPEAVRGKTLGQQGVLPADVTGGSRRTGMLLGGKGTYTRAPGVRLLGRHGGVDDGDERYAVLRPDGRTVVLTRLLHLVVRYADPRYDPATQAFLVSRAYGRLLPVEQLARVVHSRLVPAGLVAAPFAGDGSPDHTGTDRPRPSRSMLSLALRRPIVPTTVVRAAAGGLAPAFHPAVVVLVVLGVAACGVRLFVGSGDVRLGGVGDLVAVALLLAVAAVLHEFGHAAACHSVGGLPGAMGGGWYLAMPVLWTEITNGYRLDRRGRLRTDLGGRYFTGIFVVLATVSQALTGWAPAGAAAALAAVSVPFQLLPAVRLDGYPLLADVLGVTDPRQTGGAGRRPRWVMAGWAAVVLVACAGSVFLLFAVGPSLPPSVVRILGDLWRSAVATADPLSLVLSWLVLLFLLAPLLGSAVLLLRTGWLFLMRRQEGFGPLPPFDVSEPVMVDPVTAHTDSPDDSSFEGLTSWLRERPDGEATENGGNGGNGGNGHDADAGAPDAMPVSGPGPVPGAATLTASDFTEEAMLRTRRKPPGRGWRRAVYVATNGNVDPGPSAAERRREVLIARIRRPLTSCRRVVVLSRKGGAGKTTTTLMLGHVLASHRGDRVVALDANPDAGSLAYRVERENTSTITTLLGEVNDLSSYADVRAHTSQAPTRLEVVASDDDPRITQAMGQHDVKRAIQALDRHFMLILLDTGTGILDDAIQGILTEADQLVVVMPPALDGARVAASTLDWLAEHGYGRLVRSAVAVINGIQGTGGLVLLDQIERHFAERCSAVVRIPWDRSLEAGARTGLEELRPRTLEAYLELAAAVADRFPPPGTEPVRREGGSS